MLVNVGQAKTDLSKLLVRMEEGEEVVIARNGVPVAKLVAVEERTVGQRLLDGWGSHAGQGWVADDFGFTEEELDEIYDTPIDPTA